MGRLPDEKPGAAYCWACPAKVCSRHARRLGWKIRALKTRSLATVRECYCPACFAEYGWPDFPRLVTADAARRATGHDLPRVHRVGV